MVKRIMYQKIQQEKKLGKNISEIARGLSLDRKTVNKYYRMSEGVYQEYMNDLKERTKALDIYENDIISLYENNEFKKLNMAAVYDYLAEHKGPLPCTEKSVRNYIAYLVEKGKLIFSKNVRIYGKVAELPYGKQMQLDFGQIEKNGKKTYIFCALLSASRYKFAALSEKPFTTESLIMYLLECFDYFGGIPEEMVIDQDKIMVVSENAGDIIFTNKFNDFKNEQGFNMFVCRKADPESKGKIENMVGFVKHNFFDVRSFDDIETARLKLHAWLKRRANGRISQATGKIPDILYQEEKKYLNPLRTSIFRKESIVYRDERIVSDSSFISFGGSQYSVPVKYHGKSVDIYATETKLFIFDRSNNSEIASHTLSLIQGEKVLNRAHFRQKENPLPALKENTLAMFSISEWSDFTTLNFKNFSRYSRDQCIEAKKFFKDAIDNEKLKKALVFCIENKSYSFKNLHDTYMNIASVDKVEAPIISPLNINSKYAPVDIQKSDFSAYTNKLN